MKKNLKTYKFKTSTERHSKRLIHKTKSSSKRLVHTSSHVKKDVSSHIQVSFILQYLQLPPNPQCFLQKPTSLIEVQLK